MQASAGLAEFESPRAGDPPDPPKGAVSAPAKSENLEGAFTRYLRLLDSGGEPGPEDFEAVWQALRGAVVAELRRRAAWTSPPSYLGVHGWESWQARDPGPGRTESALEELLTDCYAFVFLEQRPRLRAQLATKPNVDGLVVLYLRNYLHDRRKRHDLLGFRIFESLRLAVQQAVEAGELWVYEGDPRILNATVLATTPEADPADSADAERVAPIVEGWGHDLLPDLITAGGSRRRQVTARLRRHLLDLEARGVEVFRFKDVADPLKRDVRARWASIFDHEEGETAVEDDARGFAAVARLVYPEEEAVARDSFDRLVACVASRVEGLAEAERSRHYLRTLWGFLRAWATGGGPENLPSARRLGELLSIPRKRLPRLWTLLKELVQGCQTALGGKPFESALAEENRSRETRSEATP